MLIAGLAILVLVVFLFSTKTADRQNAPTQPQDSYASGTQVTGNIDTDLNNIDAKMKSLNPDAFDASQLDTLQP